MVSNSQTTVMQIVTWFQITGNPGNCQRFNWHNN
jgi:hypothetical protein